jgi:hypothetical protein
MKQVNLHLVDGVCIAKIVEKVQNLVDPRYTSQQHRSLQSLWLHDPLVLEERREPNRDPCKDPGMYCRATQGDWMTQLWSVQAWMVKPTLLWVLTHNNLYQMRLHDLQVRNKQTMSIIYFGQGEVTALLMVLLGEDQFWEVVPQSISQAGGDM